MMKTITRLIAVILSALAFPFVSAYAAQSHTVCADDAQLAVAQGAFVIDARSSQAFAAAHLAQAASLPTDAAQLPLPQLAALLSAAGIDSSRTMLVVGDAGQPQAQALWQRLAAVTSGRVLWLVGGVQEWQMRGHALTAQITSRHAVPQFLVSFDAPANTSRMAGSRIRTSAMLERDLPVKLALN